MTTTMPIAMLTISPADLAQMIQQAVRDAFAQHDAAKPAPRTSAWVECTEAAEILRLHPRTVARLAREGKIPFGRQGSHLRFRRTDLDAYMSASG